MSACRHLYVLIHGLNGCTNDFDFITAELLRRHPDSVILTPNVNEGKTHDGIEAGARRIVEQIKEAAKVATHLSIIGHSLGGIYGRCLVGYLYEQHIIPDQLTPVNFVSITSPHLGSRSHTRILPNVITSAVAGLFFGRTLRELFLEDGDDPFMIALSKPTFVDPLKLFPNLVNYANVRYDMSVEYRTAAIRRRLLFSRENAPSGSVPYVIDEDEGGELIGGETSEDGNGSSMVESLEEEMFQRLDVLPWRRFAIVPSRALRAHNDVIVKWDNWNVAHGKPVVDHIIDRIIHST